MTSTTPAVGVTTPPQRTGATYPPRPAPDPLTDFFWRGLAEGKLLILRCRHCGHYVHHPRPICDRCQETDLAPEQVSGRGSVYAVTVVHQAFHPYYSDRVPYVVAVVDLVEEPGLRMTSNIVDADPAAIKIGQPVELTIREVAPNFFLPLFRLTSNDPEARRAGP
jgi:uncharacterized OB-fold protein